ncbi:MAG: N-acetyl-gamma-glutamyl-phosphate reductase [Actinomycetota bacterium]
MSAAPISVAVIGASGYTGGELVRLLPSHLGAELTYLGVRDASARSLHEVVPNVSGRLDATLGEIDAEEVAKNATFAFFSLPHGMSAELVPQFLDAGIRVVDLAGDFRLPADAYPEWYGFDHPSPAWLEKSVYGLPELFADKIKDASLVANPGCYPTPVILGLSPLLGAGLVQAGPIMADGKSGLSGAGKSLSEGTSYAATEESVRPYRFPRHQHTPEIEHALGLATRKAVPATFVPHLVPAVRGVLVTTYAPLAGGVTTEALTECLKNAYASAPFVTVLAPGEMADTKRVRGSNMVELHAAADPRTGTAIVVGALDNLVKGAAGQAIQNFNIMTGQDETAGLPEFGIYP